MNQNGCKNFLRTCIKNLDQALDVDNIFYYKYANRKHAEDYQTDEYSAILSDKDRKLLKTGVPYIIVCFTHLEFFAVWHQAFGKRNGKCTVSKYDLINFESNTDCDYLELIIGETENDKVYLFRNESGFNKFYQNVVPSLTV